MSSFFAGITALILILSTGNPPGFKKSDRGLTGQVKAYREKCFHAQRLKDEVVPGTPCKDLSQTAVLFDKNGHLIAEKAFSHSGEVLFRESVKWNNKGKIDKVIRYDLEGELLKETFFQYGEKGRLAAKSVKDQTGKLISRETYVFDKGGRKVKEIFTDGEGNQTKSLEIKHSSDVKTIEEFEYSTANNLVRKSKCYYGFNGKIAERKIQDQRGWLIEKIVYQYDTEDRLSRIKKYDEKDDLKFKSVKSFDKFGNMTDYRSYNKGIYLTTNLTIQYQYDDQGNWIQKTEFKNSIPLKVTLRTFYYY